MADTIPTKAKPSGEMERFAVAARKGGLAADARRLRTISLTTPAIAAGFDFAAKLH